MGTSLLPTLALTELMPAGKNTSWRPQLPHGGTLREQTTARQVLLAASNYGFRGYWAWGCNGMCTLSLAGPADGA